MLAVLSECCLKRLCLDIFRVFGALGGAGRLVVA